MNAAYWLVVQFVSRLEWALKPVTLPSDTLRKVFPSWD
jgi:hypothetical protein